MKLRKLSGFLLALAVLFSAFPLAAQEKTITILHTNDLHSNLLGYPPNLDYTPQVMGDDLTRGGFARIATILKREREKRPGATLTLDGGDFLMGTLYHLLAREEAMELRLMHALGYDAVVLGNHEFDLKPRGLARILSAAAAKDALPQVLLANALFSKESDKDDALEAEFKKGSVKPYIVVERGGLKIGIFGLMGKDAAEKAPFASPVKFAPPVETARRMVEELRNKEKVDLVICLSHSGLSKIKKVSEDEILAKEVKGIDVIVGGHSHTTLEKPLTIASTLIVQAGKHGRYVGALELGWEQGRVRLKDYRLIAVDDRVPGDGDLQRQIDIFTGAIDRQVLKERGLSFYKILARTKFDIPITEDESPLGNLIADALRWYANRYAFDPNDPASKVVVAVESNGLIREAIAKGQTGNLSVADIFRAIPLGIGMDDTMGYPIITCYLYGAEIKKALEVLTSVYPLKGSSYFLQVSGLKFTYNPWRVPFDRVTGIWLGSEEEGWLPLDYTEKNKTLYRVAANIYNATFLKIIGRFTYQILTIVPKDRQGNPIADLATARIDGDREKPGIQELKEWVGVMEYIASFPVPPGQITPEIPDKYKEKLGRIVRLPSANPLSLLSGGTWVTWTAVGALVLIILLIVALFFLIRWLMRKRRRRIKWKKRFVR